MIDDLVRKIAFLILQINLLLIWYFPHLPEQLEGLIQIYNKIFLYLARLNTVEAFFGDSTDCGSCLIYFIFLFRGQNRIFHGLLDQSVSYCQGLSGLICDECATSEQWHLTIILFDEIFHSVCWIQHQCLINIVSIRLLLFS